MTLKADNIFRLKQHRMFSIAKKMRLLGLTVFRSNEITIWKKNIDKYSLLVIRVLIFNLLVTSNKDLLSSFLLLSLFFFLLRLKSQRVFPFFTLLYIRSLFLLLLESGSSFFLNFILCLLPPFIYLFLFSSRSLQ